MERRDSVTMNRWRWDPIRELEAYSQRLNSLLSQGSDHRSRGEEPISVPDWTPPVDVVERDDEFSLYVDLPGVSKWDVCVTVDDGALHVQGERKQQLAQKSEKIHRRERTHGRFFRSFTLPESIEPWKVHGELREGVLHVRLPKRRYSPAGTVHVKVA
jgi:HSP20 family protein